MRETMWVSWARPKASEKNSPAPWRPRGGLAPGDQQEIRMGGARKRGAGQGEERLTVSGVPSPVARTFLGGRFTFGLVLGGTLKAA